MPNVTNPEAWDLLRDARAAVTATLHSIQVRDDDREAAGKCIDQARAIATEAYLGHKAVALTQCLATEFASFVAVMAGQLNMDPEDLWSLWCARIPAEADPPHPRQG
jgi:hypothetical protein